MKIYSRSPRVELRRDQLLCIEQARYARIVCLSGGLWITQHRDARDLFVPAGEAFTLDRDGVALVSALVPSSVWLQAPPSARPLQQAQRRLPALRHRLARWMRSLLPPSIEPSRGI